MARLAITLALLMAAWVAAAVETPEAAEGMAQPSAPRKKFRERPDLPQPLWPVKPCSIKNSQCVPTYTRKDADKLMERGFFDQVAVIDDDGIFPSPPPVEPQRKATCRNGRCRRPQRKGSRAEGSAKGRRRKLRPEQAGTKRPRAEPRAQPPAQ